MKNEKYSIQLTNWFAKMAKSKSYYFEETPKEKLPKGVSCRLTVRYGSPEDQPKIKGESANYNKFAHLIDPDSRRGEETRWI